MKTQGFGILIKSTACIAGLVLVTGAPRSALSYTVAEYEASSFLSYTVIGLWDVDGSPISSDALDMGVSGDFEPNITMYSVTDQDGNEIDPSGILEFDDDVSLSVYGRLLSEEYDVYLEGIDESSWYERFDSTSSDPFVSAFAFDYDLSATASSASARASAYSRAFIGAHGIYGTATISDEDKAELDLFRGVNASSGATIPEPMSGSYVFDVLFRPGDFMEFGHYYGANGGLEATIAPVPLPLGAPLLLGSVAMLMAASTRRK